MNIFVSLSQESHANMDFFPTPFRFFFYLFYISHNKFYVFELLNLSWCIKLVEIFSLLNRQEEKNIKFTQVF